MKGKKLFVLLLALCLVFGESITPVFAEELSATEESTENEIFEEDKNTETDENSMDTEEIADEENPEGAELLTEEVANVTNTMMSSISYTLTATITQEQAKLPDYTEEDLMYLSCIIYCEAGNQSLKGKIAVANVVMNRVKSDVFDHVTTIREAIYDCERWGRQFSPVYVRSGGKWTTKGSAYEKALTMYKSGSYAKEWQEEQMKECIEAARAALEGKVVIEDFLYFNMGISSTKAKCQKNGSDYAVIGCHIFY